MKYLIILFLTCILVQCKSEKEPINKKDNGIVDYLKWDKDTTYSFREFQTSTNSNVTRIFIAQHWKMINDSTWEISYDWSNINGTPINRSVEHYTKNTVTLIEQYFYELDANKKPQPVPFILSENNTCKIGSDNCAIDATIHFNFDTASTMYIHTDIDYLYAVIDTLPQSERDCLIVSSKDKVQFKFTDARRDTVINTQGKRIYAKGTGLIYFSDFDGKILIEYHVK